MKLRTRMITLISILIIGIFIIFTFFLYSFISNTVQNQIGSRALSVAKSVANIPDVKEAFELEEPGNVIQDIVIPIQEETGAEFIVVGNMDSIRYSHPNPDNIGKRMVGEDNDGALLHGDSYVSTAEGSLGLSIRGKTPIYAEDGKIIGLVSVGFLNEDIEGIISERSQSLWLTILSIITIGIIGAILIANYIKKLLSNKEPEEITQLMIEKEAILQSTHEGIIAVDTSGMLTMINQEAQKLLFNQPIEENKYIGKPITDFIYQTNILQMINQENHVYNREIVFDDTVLLVNQTSMYNDEKHIGTVFTFRDKTELEGVIKELSRIKQYANAQRAQTHEFSNKLYTILGLLQLNQQEKAIDFIKKNQRTNEKWEKSMSDRIAEPIIHAILQGKLNQANELGINMRVHPESQLAYRFSEEEQDVLLTSLGNLMENAMDAVKEQPDGNRDISILFTDIGEDIIIEIEDSGPGIKDKDIQYIFEQGFSTKKGNNRGIGLALTYQAIQRIGGRITLEEGDLGGACFVMIIPKREE